MANTHTYTKREELANAVTHGIGVLWSIIALVLLVAFASVYGSAWHIVSFAIYGSTMLLLYLCSTLVHSFPEGKVKDLFEVFDHIAIYIFIAGTYTPFTLVVIQGALGWTLFGVVWGIALAGAVFKSFFAKRFLFLSTALYVAMGWIIVVAWKPLTAALPTPGLVWLAVGGVLYSAGTIFYVWRGFHYHHAVWHMFVLAGTVCHFFAVLIYVLP